MKLEGQPFQNSDTCHGVAYATNAPLDIAEISINGRYPETGWAINHECHEVVRVSRGIGRLSLEGAITELSEGDVVHVPPKTPFAWSGEMEVTMACSPPFYPEQYELIEENSKGENNEI